MPRPLGLGVPSPTLSLTSQPWGLRAVVISAGRPQDQLGGSPPVQTSVTGLSCEVHVVYVLALPGQGQASVSLLSVCLAQCQLLGWAVIGTCAVEPLGSVCSWGVRLARDL